MSSKEEKEKMKMEEWEEELFRKLVKFGEESGISTAEMINFLLRFVACLFNENADDEDARDLSRIFYKILADQIKILKN